MNTNNSYIELEKLILNLKDVTQAILQTSLDDEGIVETIEDLQEQQELLRREIDACLVHLAGGVFPSSVKALVDECIVLERLVYKLLASYKDEMQLQITKLTQGSRARNVYQRSYPQVEGYFIDHRSKGRGQVE